MHEKVGCNEILLTLHNSSQNKYGALSSHLLLLFYSLRLTFLKALYTDD
jgi:hypothetical protein